jgi:hypothetical protein
MKFAVLALLGLVSTVRITQKIAGGDDGDDEHEDRGPPTAAQIFEMCDANADKKLEFPEAVTCAMAHAEKHIR